MYIHTGSRGMYSTQMEVSVSVSLFLPGTPPLQSLVVPNPPTLRVVLPRFCSTYLVWRDPEPFVGDIIGVQIHYLIDCVPQNIQELDSGVSQFSVSGIKGNVGKTHSISLQARTTAGWGPNSSTPLVFTFRPIGEPAIASTRWGVSGLLFSTSCLHVVWGRCIV